LKETATNSSSVGTQRYTVTCSPTNMCSLVLVKLKIHKVECICYWYFFFHGATAPSGPGPPRFRGFTITLRHTTVGRTPLDEGSTRRRDLYLTTHNTHNRQTSMPTPGFFFVRGFSPLIHFFVLFKSFSSFMSLYVQCCRPYTTNTTQTSMPSVGFELAIPTSEGPQTHALDRTATGIGCVFIYAIRSL
jgi:hypothetical protein